jgi:hypothetical protein
VAIVDLDRDLELRLITTNASRNNPSVFLGNGDGTCGLELRTGVVAVGAFPTDLAIADFDEDVAVACFDSSDMAVSSGSRILSG